MLQNARQKTRARSTKQSSEFAPNNSNDEQHQNGDDGNRDDAVCSHPNRISLATMELFPKMASIYPASTGE
jgi:hypothetical protein